MKSLFIFADIHGFYLEFIEGLKNSNFDEENPDHILVSLGDIFDRGYFSKEIYLYLLKFQKLNRFFGIKGNHDDMFLDFLSNPNNYHIHNFNLLNNGMLSTVISFLDKDYNLTGYIYGINNIRYLSNIINEEHPELLTFLKSFYDKITISNKYILLHAGLVYSDNKWKIDNWTDTRKFIKDYNEEKDKIFIFGHFAAIQLNDLFRQEYLDELYIKYKNSKEYHLRSNIFEYKNFIGLDARTVISKLVNVKKINVESLKELQFL